MENQIIHGDCMIELYHLQKHSVDLIVADLPYGMTHHDWDVPLNLNELWKLYKRVLKPNGTIVLFGREPFASELRLSQRLMWKYDYIWKKSRLSSYFHSDVMPLICNETICVFSPANLCKTSKNRPTFNPQTTKTKLNGDQGNSINLLEFNDVLISEKFHPCQKPVDLLELLIETHSCLGDVVLDNCCGSGSTLVAAKNVHRKYIGIELKKDFYDLTKLRLEVGKVKRTGLGRKKKT